MRHRPLTRRLVRFAILASVVGTLVVGSLAWSAWSGADVDTSGDLRFEQELSIPPLLEPETDATGRKLFELDLQEGEAELLAGTTTETWGVNGPYLGPTLRASRGDELAMRVSNELPETTTLHWHGMHLPAAADGGPHQLIEPGEQWEPSWQVDQPAATLWYHPHVMGDTDDHVYRGLAGMFIIDDEQAERLPLPDEYGVNDIPLIVQDKRLEDDGSLDFSQASISPTGRLGDEILVNGTHDPHLEVEHERVRLRLLNASSARIYNIGFSDEREFDLIATEGGLLASPEPMARIQLSPGERAEILVEFEPGEKVVLRSSEPELDGVDFFNERFVGGDDSFDLLELRAATELADSPELPDELVAQESFREQQPVETRRFELSSRKINDQSMDMSRIDEVVTVDTTEIWEVHNGSGIPHNFHVHDIRFELLDVDDEPPPPALSGLKDTVLVLPGQTLRLLTHFEHYADPAVPYMFHCHILEHEDRGMMGQFVVVEPGEEPAALDGHDGHR